MRRVFKIAAGVIAALIGVPILGLALLVLFANTGAGRSAIEALVARASDGELHLHGLSGSFPGALYVAEATLRDEGGVWATVDDLTLEWSPLRLLSGAIEIKRLTAARLAVTRRPQNSGSTSGGGGGLPPLSIAIRDFAIGRLELAAPVTGAAAVLKVKGEVDVASAQRGEITLDIERLDAAGRYKLAGTMAPDGDTLAVDANEPAGGFVGESAGLPALGPLSLGAQLTGPRDAERLRFSLAAGAIRANGQGTIDLASKHIDLDLTGDAPAMRPRPDVAWRSAKLDLHLHGTFTAPDAAGRIEIDGLTAAGGGATRIAAALSGNSGKIDVVGALSGVRLPGPSPDVFAASPFNLKAELILDQSTRPLTFAVTHTLLSVKGEVDTAGAHRARIAADLPSLAPFAALAGKHVAGHVELTATIAQQGKTDRLDAQAKLAVTGGDAMMVKLFGKDAAIALAGSMTGDDLTLDRAVVDGAGLHASAHGEMRQKALDLAWGATFANVGDLAATVSGPLSLEGEVKGPLEQLSLTARSHGVLATAGLPPGAVDASLSATGLPSHPAGHLELRGRLANAALALAADARREADGSLRVSLQRAQWKSIDAQGDLMWAAGAIFPVGQLQLRAARLDDLAPLLGTPLAGSIDATLRTVETAGKPRVTIHAEAQRLGVAGDQVAHATLRATIDDPVAHPVVAAQLALTGIAANGVTGSATLDANGPQDALALRLTSTIDTAHGPTQIAGAALARLPTRELTLSSLQANYRGETLRLLAPARFRFARGVAVDRLRIGAGQAVLTVAGEIAPTLHLDVALKNASLALAKSFLPGIRAAGSVALTAQLRGTMAAPTGTVRVTGRDLRIESGAGAAAPPADLDATAALHGTAMQLDLQLHAGKMVELRVTGTAPLAVASGAPIDLRVTGGVNLTVLDPLLTAEGRAVRGQMTLALTLGGNAARPRLGGTIRLTDGSLEDFVQGIHITDIAGTIAADGDTLRLTQLTGKAGAGTIAVTGTVGIFAAGLPMQLTVVARHASPLASDLLTATMDADLTVTDQAEAGLAIAGRIRVSRANIQVPDSLPQDVAVLDLRRPGQKQAPPPAPAAPVALDLDISAPEQIFVRGRGLSAEMGGALQITGNSQAPQISGGFDLRSGTFDLAGQTLKFTSGRVAFDGFGLSSGLDPTLNFVAQSVANGITATLTISGYADQPKIRLSSTPDLPQDEILAQLFFGQSVKQLTPLQLVSIAQGIAAITGTGGGLTNPLAAVREGLGLDRLSVGAASGNRPGATVEAGKYVAKGVYIGTKQGTSGGTQAQVQIDLTKHLKLQSTIATGGGTSATGVTPDNDPGSSVGLSYQFEY